MGSRDGSDDEEDLGYMPASPTPVRINDKNVQTAPSSAPSIDLRPSNTSQDYSSSSPTSSPHKRSKIVYGDRYIPSRSVNLQAAFSLVKDQTQQQSNPRNTTRRSGTNELDFQRVEEANKTFSMLLKAELFGNDVPSAVPSSSQSGAGGSGAGMGSSSSSATGFGMGASTASAQASTTRGHTTGAESRGGAGSTINSTESPISRSSDARHGRTPPRSTRSAPVTPNKNLFRYQSPSRSINRDVPFTEGGRSGIPRTRDIADATNDIYSLSPVRMDSQRLLTSPKKQPRSVPRVPYKVLDAPELADDFYLNLVDWGSKNMLAVGLAGTVYLWYAQSGIVTKLCQLPDNDRVTSVSWMKSGTHLAVGTNQGLVQIWDAEQCKRIRTMTGHEGRAGSLAWNDHLLTSGSRDRTILHRDVRIPDHYIERLTGHRQEVCGLRWNQEENQLASGSNDNRLFVWDGATRNPLYKFDHVAAVKALAWSPHQRGLLASGGGTADRRIRFWNTMTGTRLNEIDTGSQVCNLAWSKNSNEIVSTHGYSQNQVMVWKYPSMQQVAALTGHTYRVLYLAVSPDGRTVVTGAGDETLRFWNVFDDSKNSSKRGSYLLDAFQQLR